MNKDYSDLFNSFITFTDAQYQNFSGEIAKKLRLIGYNPSNFDAAISMGTVTKEDLDKRIKLYDQFINQIKELDQEIEKRNKIEPPAKRGDTFKTKQYGTILVNRSENDEVIFTTEVGDLRKASFAGFKELIK